MVFFSPIHFTYRLFPLLECEIHEDGNFAYFLPVSLEPKLVPGTIKK